MQTVAMDLTSEHDPELVQRVAQYFIENGQYERAVDLLAIGKKVRYFVSLIYDTKTLWVLLALFGKR